MPCARFVFQAVKGGQPHREYLAARRTPDCLSQTSVFNNKELSPALRAQRALNKAPMAAGGAMGSEVL